MSGSESPGRVEAGDHLESSHHVRLDHLVGEVAEMLMPAAAATVGSVHDGVVAKLATYFGVDLAFLRRNDHDARTSILVSEWPRRQIIPDPDPLGVVPFDADPQFAMSERMIAPFVAGPDENDEDYRRRVEDGSGSGDVSIAVVPMNNAAVTVGCLGFVSFGDRIWRNTEVQALQAIASMLVQVQARIQAEEQLSHQAYHDHLTGLPNWVATSDRLEQSLCQPGNKPVALIFVDLDDLKVVNDALGHETGDLVLQSMADDLASVTRAGEFVGRTNGDEFMVIVDEGASEQVALLIAKRIGAALSRPIDVNGRRLSRSVSIGVTLGKAGVSTASSLMAEADAAMYRAKSDGKNAIRLFDATLQAQVLERYEQQVELRAAIDNDGEITVHYQPEVDLLNGKLLGVEALARWQHPIRGLLPASAFIETAEASGIVVPLGRIILRAATAQLAAWNRDHPGNGLKMRVNASPAQLLDPDFVSEVANALAQHDLEPSSLCIEVTEHVVMDHGGHGIEILGKLRALGVELAIDDFGTGYSSMSHLKQLPIDTLKIDRAFVDTLATDPRDQAIVEAMIRLADAFHLDVVAEGVETEAQLIELASRGCRRAQGYLLARPMAADDLESWIGKPVMAGSLDLANGDALASLAVFAKGIE